MNLFSLIGIFFLELFDNLTGINRHIRAKGVYYGKGKEIAVRIMEGSGLFLY